MRRTLLLAFLMACWVVAPASAQNTDDYNKYDIFVGFSHNRVDTGFGDEDDDFDDIIDEREGFNGFNISAKGNVSRYVGIKGDYSFHRRSFVELSSSFRVDIHNLVGGVEFKNNSRDRRVKPFAHVMAGIAHEKVRFDNGTDLFDESDTGLSGILGGGIDFRINDRVDIRAVQFDWNPTRLNFDNNRQTFHNFRIGIGIVFR